MKVAVFLFLLLTAGQPAPRAVEEPWEPEPREHHIQPRKIEAPREYTLFDITFDISIRAYKFLLADQQGDVCAFEPSCSQYAQEAVRSQGPILGLLLASDRLIRCNWSAWSYAPKYYGVVYTKNGMKLSDPVSKNLPKGEAKK